MGFLSWYGQTGLVRADYQGKHLLLSDLTFCIQAGVWSYIALLGWTPLIKEYKITPSLRAVAAATAWSRLNTFA